MLGPHIARELARRRDEDIARGAARHRRPEPSALPEALPTLSIVAGVALLVALGAPVVP